MATKKIKRTFPKVVKSQSVGMEDYSAKDECKSSSSENCCCGEKKSVLKIHLAFLLIIVVVLGMLGYFFRDKILVAIVNGKPIFRYQLNDNLTKSFGKDALENLIVESLIKDEVKKNQIAVSEQDVNKEVEKISKSLSGGMKIEDALKAQGMTLADLQSQLKLRLQVNKVLEKEISVSTEEVDKFIKDSAGALTATTEAEKRVEATKVLEEQKLNTKIQTWISDLLAKAKISRYLK